MGIYRNFMKKILFPPCEFEMAVVYCNMRFAQPGEKWRAFPERSL